MNSKDKYQKRIGQLESELLGFRFAVEELKICEELYYHSSHNPKYISELNQALKEIGITPKSMKERELKLKDKFLTTDFYKTALI